MRASRLIVAGVLGQQQKRQRASIMLHIIYRASRKLSEGAIWGNVLKAAIHWTFFQLGRLLL
jgi:hypothetical protein